MDIKTFILKLVELIKGTLIGKVILALISGGLALLGASPFFDKYISAALSKYLSIETSDPSAPIGIFLIILGVALTIWERKNIISIEHKKIDSNSIDEELKVGLKENQFISFKNEVEKNCHTIIRRLIEKHHDIDYNPQNIKDLGKRALYGDDQATVQYIDSVMVGNNIDRVKTDFLVMAGDATGQPIIYNFVKQYQSLMERGEADGYMKIVKGTPLFQAYENITHPAFIDLRRAAYWEDFV